MLLGLLLAACSDPECDSGFTFNVEGLCVVDTGHPAPADADTDTDGDSDADGDTDPDTGADTGDTASAMVEEEAAGLQALVRAAAATVSEWLSPR